jgi:hypothetical protein
MLSTQASGSLSEPLVVSKRSTRKNLKTSLKGQASDQGVPSEIFLHKVYEIVNHPVKSREITVMCGWDEDSLFAGCCLKPETFAQWHILCTLHSLIGRDKRWCISCVVNGENRRPKIGEILTAVFIWKVSLTFTSGKLGRWLERRSTVVSGRLNVVKGREPTNQIVSFTGSWHLICW